MSFELYFQTTYGPQKNITNWIMYVLNILCPNIILSYIFVMGINITQRKMPEVLCTRLIHKDAEVTEQIRCNVDLQVIIFTWLYLFLGCDYDGGCGPISVKKS